MKRIAHVKDKCPSGIVIVRKEHAAGGHDIFGVMNKLCRLVGSGRRHQFSVCGRCWGGVDDGERMIALMLQILRPSKKVMAGLGGVLGLHRDYDEREKQGQGEQQRSHGSSERVMPTRKHIRCSALSWVDLGSRPRPPLRASR